MPTYRRARAFHYYVAAVASIRRLPAYLTMQVFEVCAERAVPPQSGIVYHPPATPGETLVSEREADSQSGARRNHDSNHDV